MNSPQSATILISAHDNKSELQHTVNSVIRALDRAEELSLENIVILDEQGLYGTTYDTGKTKLRVVNSLKEHSISGELVYIIPALTIVSENWFFDSLNHIKNHPASEQLRPEIHVEWGEQLETQILRQPQVLDPLYSIQAPQYSGVVCVSSTRFIQELNDCPGVLSKTQWINLGLGWLNKPSTIIPLTVVFTRINKDDKIHPGSVRSPLFAFSSAKESQVSDSRPDQPKASTVNIPITPKARKELLRLTKGVMRRTHVLDSAAKLYRRVAPRTTDTVVSELPSWLLLEWRALHRIDNRLFPSKYIATSYRIKEMPAYEAQKLAVIYKQLSVGLTKDHYDYILFAPWLVRGGADKFTIEYANTIALTNPNLKVLVITTLERESEWKSKLNDSVDYCDLGCVASSLPNLLMLNLLGYIIRQSVPKVLHVINSELAYNFIASSKDWLREQKVQVIATSFSQEIDPNGKLLGYSHSHVPEVYHSLSMITSDNAAVLNMWQADYGFDRAKLTLHHLPYDNFDKPSQNTRDKNQNTSKKFKVLWASRLSPEKSPELVVKIGGLLQSENIEIDMYGTAAPNFETLFLQNLPDNVRYRGSFDGMNTLPLRDYDAFLYTSLFDGMPNTLLEIGSSGLPIVSSAVGGIPELIIDKETGLLASNNNDPSSYAALIRSLRDNPDLGHSLAQNLRKGIANTYSEHQFKESVTEMLDRFGLLE